MTHTTFMLQSVLGINMFLWLKENNPIRHLIICFFCYNGPSDFFFFSNGLLIPPCELPCSCVDHEV